MDFDGKMIEVGSRGTRGNPVLLVSSEDPDLTTRLRPNLEPWFELRSLGFAPSLREQVSRLAPVACLVDLRRQPPEPSLEFLAWLTDRHPEVFSLALLPNQPGDLLARSQAAGARVSVPSLQSPERLATSLRYELEIARNQPPPRSRNRRPRRRPLAQELWTLWPSAPRTGQTTTALSLAAALAARGQRVLLVDLAPGLSPVSRFLDLPRIRPSLREVVESLDLIRPSLAVETLFRAPSGFSVLPLGDLTEGPEDVRATLTLLLAFSDLVDHVLIDVPHRERPLWTSLLDLSRRLVVTGDDSPQGIRRCRDLIQYLSELSLEPRLVPLQIQSECSGEDPDPLPGIPCPFQDMLRSFPLVNAGQLPYRPEQAAESLVEARPLSEIAPEDYGRAIRSLLVPLLPREDGRLLARELTRPPRDPEEEKTPSLIQRLFSRPPKRSDVA